MKINVLKISLRNGVYEIPDGSVILNQLFVGNDIVIIYSMEDESPEPTIELGVNHENL